MAIIDELIQQIKDDKLRDRIQAEADKLTQQKKFGLVFENHLPECTPLYEVPVLVGSTVSLKSGSIDELYLVKNIKEEQVFCVNKKDGKEAIFPLKDVVITAEFGEPIYPYLQYVDSLSNAPDSELWHTLIEADNYHALQLLGYLYAGKVDCIYIDPPYNTRDDDWKYNNNYVDSSDSYRHSKWLSMMEKRMKLAKKLLNPEDGVLIVAIDDYEFAHLTVLLEELFSEYDRNTIVVNHHPQGGSADNVARTHEYAIFVTPKGKKVIFGNKSEDIEDKWSLMRGGTNERNLRIGRPKSFYAIYINKSTLKIEGVGPELEANESYDLNETPNDCIAMYPIGKDGKERVWRYTRSSMIQHIHNGDIVCTPNLSLQVIKRRDTKHESVVSVWTDTKYNAGTSGTPILQQIFYPNNRFPYPKSLYSILDCIKYSTLHKPKALIVDFFAGSGTTLHAVNLLNAEDGGQRRCIMVTNNEVSKSEATSLTDQGYQPGDEEWERLGIARYVAWPRTICSIKGVDINGKPLKGDYGTYHEEYQKVEEELKNSETNKAVRGKLYRLKKNVPDDEKMSEMKMADGFQSNAIYFKLGFLDKTSIALGRQFKELLSVLWMKAGAIGPCPQLEGEDIPKMLILPDNHFAVLTDEKDFPEFFEQVKAAANIETVFIVTDSEAGYREMAAKLQAKTSYQLYRDYLDNFRINTGRK